MLGIYIFHNIVWPVYTTWNPNDQDCCIINLLSRDSWQVIWLNFIVKTNHLFLNPVYLAVWNTFYRSFGNAAFFFNSNKYVSTSQIVNIIGKSANALVNFAWIPSTLELDSIVFNLVFVQ